MQLNFLAILKVLLTTITKIRNIYIIYQNWLRLQLQYVRSPFSPIHWAQHHTSIVRFGKFMFYWGSCGTIFLVLSIRAVPVTVANCGKHYKLLANFDWLCAYRHIFIMRFQFHETIFCVDIEATRVSSILLLMNLRDKRGKKCRASWQTKIFCVFDFEFEWRAFIWWNSLELFILEGACNGCMSECNPSYCCWKAKIDTRDDSVKRDHDGLFRFFSWSIFFHHFVAITMVNMSSCRFQFETNC